MMTNNVITCNEKNGFDEQEKFLGLEYRDIDAICRNFDNMYDYIMRKHSSDHQNDA